VFLMYLGKATEKMKEMDNLVGELQDIRDNIMGKLHDKAKIDLEIKKMIDKGCNIVSKLIERGHYS
jgi:hypothetical protein